MQHLAGPRARTLQVFPSSFPKTVHWHWQVTQLLVRDTQAQAACHGGHCHWVTVAKTEIGRRPPGPGRVTARIIIVYSSRTGLPVSSRGVASARVSVTVVIIMTRMFSESQTRPARRREAGVRPLIMMPAAANDSDSELDLNSAQSPTQNNLLQVYCFKYQ